MSTNERDTHFAEYAHLHCEEVSQLFFALYARIAELRPFEEIDALEREIETLMARRAYDLLFHILKHSDPDYLDMVGYDGASEPSDKVVHENLAHLPDMTSFPD